MPKNYDLYLKGTVGGWDFNADMVNWILDKKKDSEVNVLVDSLGGYTSDGVSISSLFKIHGNVHVHFAGYNASAATIAAMGAKRISIDEDAAFLVHKCMYLVLEWDYMNADELDAHIKVLEKTKKDAETLDSCIAGMYARRCKKSKDELLELMKEGGWLTPEQALEWGFVDEITRYAEEEKPQLSAATISSLSAAGIPLPPNVQRKKGSILDRFIAFLQSPFNNQSNNPSEDGAKPEPDKINNSTAMANLTALAALLGATLAMSDDKLSLSDDQASKLNDAVADYQKKIADLEKAVADKDAEIKSLKDSVAEKDATIADLKKTPAESTSDVHDNDKDTDPYAPVSQADAMAASKAFLESAL